MPAAQARGEMSKGPVPIGTYLSTPIVLDDGQVYGTLCCFSFGINPSVTWQDVKTLRYHRAVDGAEDRKGPAAQGRTGADPDSGKPFRKL